MENQKPESRTSFATKKHLSETLKKMMLEQKFNKITISALVEAAGLNRKTFYYHFKSTGELLAWTFEREALDQLADFNFIDDYDEALNFIMNYLEQNRELIKSAANSIGRGELRRFLYDDFYRIILKHVRRAIPDEPADFQEGVAEFYSEGMAGMLLRWIDTPNPAAYRDRAQLIDYFKRLFRPYLERPEFRPRFAQPQQAQSVQSVQSQTR